MSGHSGRRGDLLVASHDRPRTRRPPGSLPGTRGTSQCLTPLRKTDTDRSPDESVVPQRARTARFRRRCGHLRTRPSGCFLLRRRNSRCAGFLDGRYRPRPRPHPHHRREGRVPGYLSCARECAQGKGGRRSRWARGRSFDEPVVAPDVGVRSEAVSLWRGRERRPRPTTADPVA